MSETISGGALLDREARFQLEPPRARARLRELRVLFEVSSLVPSARSLAQEPRGDGRSIVVVPGFLTDDRSTWALRRYLRFLGYDARGWGLGLNRGDPEGDVARVADSLAPLSAQGVTLIGWSLGGVIARGVAQREPGIVREVITLGTPIEGGPKYTRARGYYEKRGVDLDALEQRVHDANSEGLAVPLTVIFSRLDGIVGWRAAVDRYNPQARHVEVDSSHMGLGFHPVVWRTIARGLAS